MKYTIITACLNSINTISKTVDSILVQKYLPFQYIFIDGGSNDGTIEYIYKTKKNIKKQGINCLLINQKTKGGIYEAWNLGLAEVSVESDFVFILNSDDWYLENTIELVSNFFNNNVNVDILCGQSLNYSNGKKIISKNKSLHLFPFLMPINHPASFIKKNVYLKIGDFNKDYKVSGDYDFLLKIIVRDMKHYQDFVLNSLGSVKNIGSAHSTFVMGVIKHSTEVPLR